MKPVEPLMMLRIGKKIKTFGFTLLELMVILVIMGMFFGISVPLFSRLTEGTKLKTTARSITSTLRTARGYAITNNDNYYVFFDPSTSPHSYFISAADDGSVVIEKVHKLPIGLWFFDPTTINTGIGFTEGIEHPDFPIVRAALFKPTGELVETSNNTSVYIADGQDASAEWQQVTVERTTGRARVN